MQQVIAAEGDVRVRVGFGRTMVARATAACNSGAELVTRTRFRWFGGLDHVAELVPLLLGMGVGAALPLRTATRLAEVGTHTCLETAILNLQGKV